MCPFLDLMSFRLHVKGKHSAGKEFPSLAVQEKTNVEKEIVKSS